MARDQATKEFSFTSSGYDPVTGDGTALIRMEPGCAYPSHRHHGIEEVLILQGGYRDPRRGASRGRLHHQCGGLGAQPRWRSPIMPQDCIMFAVAPERY